MKYVINERFGGFGLSEEAFEFLIKEKGWTVTKYNEAGGYENPEAQICDSSDGKFSRSGLSGKYYIAGDRSDLKLRCNEDLVECVETLGDKANGRFAGLVIRQAPSDFSKLEIHDYDGMETLQTIPKRF